MLMQLCVVSLCDVKIKATTVISILSDIDADSYTTCLLFVYNYDMQIGQNVLT